MTDSLITFPSDVGSFVFPRPPSSLRRNVGMSTRRQWPGLDVARFVLIQNRLLSTKPNKTDMLHHEFRRPRNATHHEGVAMSFKTQSAFPPSRTAQTGRRCATLGMGIRAACGSPPSFSKSRRRSRLSRIHAFLTSFNLPKLIVASRFSLLACNAISLATEGFPCSPEVTHRMGNRFQSKMLLFHGEGLTPLENIRDEQIPLVCKKSQRPVSF